MGRFDDCIVGPATAPGEAGGAGVRLSGPGALAIASKFFFPKHQGPLKTWQLYYGWLKVKDKTLDEALLAWFKAPKSYTAEEVVEIQSHGGGLITKKIIELCLEAGARLARPGEFTMRAFVNGRIDLTQAEAVGDLIAAKTERALEMVVNQLKGRLYEKIQALKEEVGWALALVNASLDFPEEEVVFSKQGELLARLNPVKQKMEKLLETAQKAQILREGYRLVLAGEPNVGKSSLLNGLLEEARAIVTNLPGTTRDPIAESLSIEGVPVRLVDTAGLRPTTDIIEAQGIEKTLNEVAKADLLLWVIDGSDPHWELALPPLIEAQAQSHQMKRLLVLNKMDLADSSPQVPAHLKNLEQVEISALEEEGLAKLKAKIGEFIKGHLGELSEDSMLTNLRQEQAARLGLEAIKGALAALKMGEGEELLAIDLSQCLTHLGEIVGETTPDDLLERIFSNFCIGK